MTDRIEQVKKILEPVCRERAITFATKVNQIEDITKEMTINLAEQIDALYQSVSDTGDLLLTCEEMEQLVVQSISKRTDAYTYINIELGAKAELAKATPLIREQAFKEVEEWIINNSSDDSKGEV